MSDTQDAAPSSTESNAHGIGPDTDGGPNPDYVAEAGTTTLGESAAPVAAGGVNGSAGGAAPAVGEDPNAATGAAALPAIVASALGASIPTGILGTVESLPAEVAGYIRTHLAEIKQHLSIKGFEQSAVQFIHDKIAAIEKWL